MQKPINDSTSPISSNATPKELLRSIEGAMYLKRIVDFAAKFGIKNKAVSKALEEVPTLLEKVKKLSELPDRFNRYFSSRGWIAHESQNGELLETAVALAELGSFDEAENILTNHYDEKAIDFIFLHCKWSNAFGARWDLAQAAKREYLSERYDSGVPLQLMLLDGFVNDIAQTGFFTDRTDLTAWDSIAAHNSGLKKLAEIFGAKRTKTTTDIITIPYRNGILHGRDLGYANKIVAAKCWAALSAISDWAAALRDGKKLPKPKPSPPPFMETLGKMLNIEQRKKLIESWKPRTIILGETIPSSEVLEEYLSGSPEAAVANLFTLWKKRNFGKMAELLFDFSRRTLQQRAGEIRAEFGTITILSFSIVYLEDVAPSAANARVLVDFSREGASSQIEVSLRLLYQNEKDDPRIYPHESGKWVILQFGFNNLIYPPLQSTN